MISVIVPIYGVEKYLRKCVESILAQNMSKFEIILVDDGSPDKCPEICDEYAQKDARIKVVHKENGGLASARKAGLSAASGEYIGFVDGDDWVEPDMYSEFQLIADKYAPDMIVSEYFCDFEGKTEISGQCFSEGLYSKKRLLNEIYPKILYSGRFYRFGISPNCWSKLFRRELLEKNLPLVDDRTRMGEDAAFTFACMLEANSIYCIKNPKYHYRIVPSSMSRGYDENLEKIIYLPYEAIKKYSEKSSFDISGQLAYYHIYLANFLIRNEAKAKVKDKEFVKRLLADTELKKSVETVKFGSLPVHTRFIVSAVRKNRKFALNVYIWLMEKRIG